MKAIARLADRRPLMFVLLTLLVWFILGIVIVVLVARIFQIPVTDNLPQIAGTLAATGLLMLVVSRLGWLRAMGITSLGTWSAWGVSLLIGLYLTFTSLYAFFGDISLDVSSLLNTEAARSILLRNTVAGFVEETLFRGIFLYALVRIWGKTKRGLVAAVFVQAGLFSCLHALQVFAGNPLPNALLSVLYTFVFGLWIGFLVLNVATIWPAIVLHAFSNIIVLTKALSSSWVDPVSMGYLQATLFELPLVLAGLWFTLKVMPSQKPAPATFIDQDDGS